MTLADLGADVIKVERPKLGDETRGWGPPFDDRGESAYFLSCNRNKLSVAADLDDARDRELLHRLIEGADVVVDNFRRGTLERRGIEPDRLLDRRASLIWCTITGFGSESDRPGYDFVVQAECGWMAITGATDGPPTKVGVALADITAGKDATIAVIAELAAGARGARPARARRIWISLAHSAAAVLMNVAQNALVSGKEAKRWGNAHPNLVPYQLFEAADRPIVVAVGSDAQWVACARALDLPELADDARLATNAGRLAHREMLVGVIGRRVSERDAAEWLTRLQRAGVACGVVKSVLEALADVDASPLTGVAPSVPGTVRRPPPRLDEHGDAIRATGWDVF